jgi:hypothetical protein
MAKSVGRFVSRDKKVIFKVFTQPTAVETRSEATNVEMPNGFMVLEF